MLDHLLAVLLLLVVPARALWRSRSGRISTGSKTARYLTVIGMVGGMLTLLATDWLMTGRSIHALGLGIPTSMPALIGLGLAVVLLAILGLSRRDPSTTLRPDVEAVRRELFPDTPGEMRLFLLVTLAAGAGWEILYRGFLLFYLPSTTGLSGAVIISAGAYGAAHGFKTAKHFVASIVSALAFTIGYAVTANLWWLMLLHIGLMLLGALAGRAAGRLR